VQVSRRLAYRWVVCSNVSRFIHIALRPWTIVLIALCCCTAALGAAMAALAARETPASQGRVAVGLSDRFHDDRGLYVAFCPEGAAQATPAAAAVQRSLPRAATAMASHAGWPADECLKMDKGPPGRAHTIVGLKDVHNWLLGGYGNDTIIAGDHGDVIWGDYHSEGQPSTQRDYIHGGAGSDWIYSSHGYNVIWTGAGDDHLALVYGHGTVYCNGLGLKTLVMRYLPQNRHWHLVGCRNIVIDRYRA
jgi:RTX calcium-binding nonapeptide repeat (4 copies)